MPLYFPYPSLSSEYKTHWSGRTVGEGSTKNNQSSLHNYHSPLKYQPEVYKPAVVHYFSPSYPCHLFCAHYDNDLVHKKPRPGFHYGTLFIMVHWLVYMEIHRKKVAGKKLTSWSMTPVVFSPNSKSINTCKFGSFQNGAHLTRVFGSMTDGTLQVSWIGQPSHGEVMLHIAILSTVARLSVTITAVCSITGHSPLNVYTCTRFMYCSFFFYSS